MHTQCALSICSAKLCFRLLRNSALFISMRMHIRRKGNDHASTNYNHERRHGNLDRHSYDDFHHLHSEHQNHHYFDYYHCCRDLGRQLPRRADLHG